ncbi:MAG: hypothetical protein AAF990_26725 [Bacteroidota bacterium]
MDREGYILESCDSIFSVDFLTGQTAVKWYPFLESIFPSLQELSVGSPEIRFTRIEPGMKVLPGIYDFTFMLVQTDGQEQILWGIYDYTWLYEQFRELQQRRNELEIQRHLMEQNYRKLRRQKDILLRKNLLLESFQKVQYQYYDRLRMALQSPINALDGLIGQYFTTNGAAPPPLHFLRTLKTSVFRLQEIMEELEMIARIGADSQSPEVEIPFELQETLDGVNMVLREYMEEEGAIEYDILDDVPNQLVGRPIYLQQILYSLFVHTFRYHLWLKMRLEISVSRTEENTCILELRLVEQDVKEPHASENWPEEDLSQLVLHLTIARKLIEIQQGSIHLEEDTQSNRPNIICYLPFSLPNRTAS